MKTYVILLDSNNFKIRASFWLCHAATCKAFHDKPFLYEISMFGTFNNASTIGNDSTISVCGISGNFELNVMMPVMAHNLLESIELLARSSENFTARCVQGIEAEEARCRSTIEQSLSMCTALAPVIGHDHAAKVAKEAYRSGKTVREVAMAQNVLARRPLAKLMDPWSRTKPAVKRKTKR